MPVEDLQLRVLGDTVRATEDTLRAYDLKAEIAMICFVLSIEAINVFISLGKLRDNRPVLCGFLFLLFIAAMVGYMTVLLPIYKRKAANAASYLPINIFFVTKTKQLSVDQYLRALDASDVRSEMAQQVIMLSEIRDSKNRRFLFALFITLAFYALVLVAGLFGFM